MCGKISKVEISAGQEISNNYLERRRKNVMDVKYILQLFLKLALNKGSKERESYLIS